MKNDILKMLSKFDGQEIAIIGDIILDHYQWGQVCRISPEAPVPVVYVESETYRLGGAANVARNIKAMGAQPFLMGVVGKDEYGRQIQDLLAQEGIPAGLCISEQRKTTLKTRVMGNNQQIVRIDIENLNPLTSQEFNRLKELYASSPLSEHVIVSDYGKGTVNDATLNMVKDRKTVIDPKNINFHRYQNIFIMTPNKLEAAEGSGVRINSREDIIKAGRKIMTDNKSDNLLITMGPQGMVLFSSSGDVVHIKSSARNVFDVTGAGDTVIAVMGACLECGIDLESGCILANLAAGIVVGQIGTAAAGVKEVQSVITQSGMPEVSRWN